MQWTSNAIILSARPHGENSLILSVLTPEFGRHMGYIKAGRSSRYRGLLEIGNIVEVEWYSRIEDQLGSFRIEPVRNYAANYMDDRLRLSAIHAACGMADATMPERQKAESVYNGLEFFLEQLAGDVWAETYVFWEVALLKELGFGLDLQKCAATGQNDHLAYVSPKSGRAVSLSAAEPYKDKLLPLPLFLQGKAGEGWQDIFNGLNMTGYFFQQRIFAMVSKLLPEARVLFQDRIKAMCPQLETELEKVSA